MTDTKDSTSKKKTEVYSTTDRHGRTRMDVKKLLRDKMQFLEQLATPPGKGASPIKETKVVIRPGI